VEQEEEDNMYGTFVCLSGFVSKWIVEGRESAICYWILVYFETGIINSHWIYLCVDFYSNVNESVSPLEGHLSLEWNDLLFWCFIALQLVNFLICAVINLIMNVYMVDVQWTFHQKIQVALRRVRGTWYSLLVKCSFEPKTVPDFLQ
jgi:hypothetical protein